MGDEFGDTGTIVVQERAILRASQFDNICLEPHNAEPNTHSGPHESYALGPLEPKPVSR
jgi:hypothetical protein